jgi:two-component system sensor histidine kinase UhpB
VIARFRPAGWSFATRLMALALVPAFLMLIVVNASLYLLSFQEAQADIRERGRVLAAALSESSRYGVVSGNPASVQRAVEGLMDVDRSLVMVEVMSSDRQTLVLVKRAEPDGRSSTQEAAINLGSLDVDLLDRGVLPVPPSASAQANSRVAGYVRVTMSPTPLLEAKRSRLIQGSVLVLLACAVATAVGLLLARRLRRPLNLVMAALRQMRRGSFDVRIAPIAGGEIGELQQAILEMAKSLGATHQELENEVGRRTAQLQEAISALAAADAERRRLIARGNELVEEERRRLSLEIHDELNAALISVRLQAAALSSHAAHDDRPEVEQAAARIASLTDDLYKRARAIVTQLRPEILDTLGLAGAVEEMVRRFDEVHTGCRFRFQADTLPAIPDSVAIAAYRAVQEALSNVAKHANASTCNVALSNTDAKNGPTVRVVVQDDGRGYDTNVAHPEGIGLIGMRERIAALRGQVVMTSTPGEGTTVTIEIPLDPAPNTEA